MRRLAMLGVCLMGLVLAAPCKAKTAHSTARPATPPPLTASDETQRRQAVQRLNDRNPVMVGMVERWQGETAEGTVRLDRIYRDHGLDCHVFSDNFRSGAHGHWRLAHLVWCRVPEGSWRQRG